MKTNGTSRRSGPSAKRTLGEADPRRRRSGFTIAELMIVIGIIGILSTIGFRSYRDQTRRTEYNNALTQVVGMIQTARNYATTSRQAYDGSNLVFPVEGYGVNINKNTGLVTLFANTSGTDDNANLLDTGDVVEESFQLPIENSPAKFTVMQLKGFLDENDADLGSWDSAVIIFRPPYGDVYIGNHDNTDTADTLTMVFHFIFAPEADTDHKIRINRVAGFPELIQPWEN